MEAPIVDINETIAGEGPIKGEHILILRLAGCNLRCNYCDSKYTFDTSKYKMYSSERIISYILKIMKERKIYNLMITGGEPLLNEDFVNEVAIAIGRKGNKVYVETNGTIVPKRLEMNGAEYIEYFVDIKSPSSGNPSNPKIIKSIVENYAPYDVIFKYIFENKKDLDWIIDNFIDKGIIDGYDLYFGFINEDLDINKIPKEIMIEIIKIMQKYGEDIYIYVDCQMHKLVDWGNEEAESLLDKM